SVSGRLSARDARYTRLPSCDRFGGSRLVVVARLSAPAGDLSVGGVERSGDRSTTVPQQRRRAITYNRAMERYRIRPDAAVYYLTYSLVEWLSVFVTEATCKIVADSLTFCHAQKQLRINAFVIMPTHMHMIVFDADFDTERLIRTLADFRKF